VKLKIAGALAAAVAAGVSILPTSPARAAGDATSTSVSETDIAAAADGLVLGYIAEETRLAQQWAESVARVAHCPDPTACDPMSLAVQKGHAFEVMARDAHNARHPGNKATLETRSNAAAVDGELKTGRKIQMKASDNEYYQRYGVRKLDEAGYGDGELWVPKGNKILDSARVKESPVSQGRIWRASEATARAESTAAMVLEGAKIGGAVSAGIETGVQAYELWTKRGEGVTLADWTKAGAAIATAAGCGSAAGAAGAYSGGTAAPVVTPIGGAGVGLIVGGVTYFGCEWGLGRILSGLR
jgi:hypothetical protein